MASRVKKWKVSLTVVSDIGVHPGTLTKHAAAWRIKEIIRDEIDNWRDLTAKNIVVKKAGRK